MIGILPSRTSAHFEPADRNRLRLSRMETPCRKDSGRVGGELAMQRRHTDGRIDAMRDLVRDDHCRQHIRIARDLEEARETRQDPERNANAAAGVATRHVEEPPLVEVHLQHGLDTVHPRRRCKPGYRTLDGRVRQRYRAFETNGCGRDVRRREQRAQHTRHYPRRGTRHGKHSGTPAEKL